MTSFSEFFPLIREFGSIILIFWLVWRTTQKTLPDIVKKAETAQQKARDDFKEVLKQQREDLLAVISAHTKSTAQLAESTACHVKEAVVARAEISQREREFFEHRMQKEHDMVMLAVATFKTAGGVR